MSVKAARRSAIEKDIWFNWNGLMIEVPRPAPAYSGTFFDETLRDGIQAPGIRNITVPEKLGLIDHMVRCGVRAADLGFPGSGPAALRECTEIAKSIVASGYPLRQAYAGRTHPADIGAIAEIAQAAGVGVDAYVSIGASPIRQYVEDWDVALIQSRVRTSVTECRRGGVDLVLVVEDAVRCPPGILGKIYRIAIDAGVRRVTLCDTAGVALPTGTTALVNWSNLYFSYYEHPVAFDWHGHNDRGLALINSLTALELGCSRVHATILGVGERAGNASLDQLMVNTHLDQHGEYDLAALRGYCEYAESVLGVSIPPNYPAMGADVFKTSARGPAAAILKAHDDGNAQVKDAVCSSVPARLLGRAPGSARGARWAGVSKVVGRGVDVRTSTFLGITRGNVRCNRIAGGKEGQLASAASYQTGSRCHGHGTRHYQIASRGLFGRRHLRGRSALPSSGVQGAAELARA